MLGLPRSKAGQVVGWVYSEDNPVGDNFVDFGLYADNLAYSDFVNGYDNGILLDFNVDGNVLDLMWTTGLNALGSGNSYRDFFDYYPLYQWV